MASKKQISAKQVGKNIIVIIDNVKHSKAIPTPEERKEILSKVETYNKKNSDKILKEIITKLAPPAKESKKEKVVKEKPKTVRTVKKEEVKKVEEKVKEEPKTIAPATRRSGREW